MFVKGQLRRRCWQTSDGPLEVEGGLLSGQAVSLEKVGAVGRQIVIKTAIGVGHFASQARRSDRGATTPGRWRYTSRAT